MVICRAWLGFEKLPKIDPASRGEHCDLRLWDFVQVDRPMCCDGDGCLGRRRQLIIVWLPVVAERPEGVGRHPETLAEIAAIGYP
ncbi:MAG: hypothetical protein JXA67_21150, partial [Micromonosporaceae bacterium]|nr:hypothetical protein [Micromonosporaceae bacterium]